MELFTTFLTVYATGILILATCRIGTVLMAKETITIKLSSILVLLAAASWLIASWLVAWWIC